MTEAMTPAEYSTPLCQDSPLDTIARLLDAAAPLDPDGRGNLLAPRRLQSWPGIVHGGGLLALFDHAAAAVGGPAGPRTLEGRLTASVPIETPLRLEARRDEAAVSLAVRRDGHTLSAGVVKAQVAGAVVPAWQGGRAGWALPMSEDCLACGARNPLGLRAGLRFDDEGVWARLEPSTAWRAVDGSLDPALGPVLLDEVAWWLGALVAKAGGLTNRLAITLTRPDWAFGPVVAAGRFEHVAPVDKKRVFWRTESALMAPDGALLATASIVFRGGAEYSARQMDYFRARTPPAVFRRMFPDRASRT
jgi:hypothetical protein